MNRLLKNITSVLLLMVFLLPSFVKLEHHHEHFECKAKSEKHIHEKHEQCVICNYQFSEYSTLQKGKLKPSERIIAKYCNNYSSIYYSSSPKYLFLLRAPPLLNI